MDAPFVVKWTPLPVRRSQNFPTLDDAVAFAVRIASPRMGSVDILQPNGRTLSVIATERKS